jgi:predicted TIM-barrel fold metal-dependent hydrolase
LAFLLSAFRNPRNDPERPDFDSVIDTDEPLHGEQEGWFFHGYYGHYCYLPLHLFVGEHLLCARLRAANIDAAAGMVDELERIVGRIRQVWPTVQIVIRADSGFCPEELMAWCEANGADYLLGLAKNPRLVDTVAAAPERVATRYAQTGKAAREFVELRYRTRERRLASKSGSTPPTIPDLQRSSRRRCSSRSRRRRLSKMRIIDFHTHAFPDAVAARAMPGLEEEGNIRAALDGKLSSLLRSMGEAGIQASVVASIATRPSQFEPILKWSGEIASERIVPFPSVHPDDPQLAAHVHRIADQGFKGLKLHPYYQDFDLDEARLQPLWAAAQERALIVLCHTGFDLAFERVRRGDPARVLRLLDAFPGLRFVASHLGAWEDWDEVEEHLAGRPILMDLSFAIDDIGPARARELILRHPPEYILFGTDSPWAGQQETIEQVRLLELGPERERLLFGANAARLLELDADGP